jgi:O-antigen ligase
MINRVRGISKKIATFCLFGYFFSTTFSHALGQIFFALALMAVIVLTLTDRERRSLAPRLSSFSLFVILYIGWSIFSSLMGPTPTDSLFTLKEEWLFLMIPVAAYLTRDEKVMQICLKVFAIAVIAVSLYAVWQHFTGLDLYHGKQLDTAPSTGYRVVGTFSHRLTFGNYYAIASLLLLGIAPYVRGRISKWLFFGAFSLSAIAAGFTYSRGPIVILIICIISFVVLAGRKYWKIVIPLLVCLILVIAIASPDIFSRYETTLKTEWEGQYAGSRLSIWRTGVRMALDHPVFGVAPGNFDDQYITYRDDNSDRIYSHAHNDILDVAARIGFPGAVFFVGFWLAIFLGIGRLLRSIKGDGFLKGMATGTLLATVAFFMTSVYEATFADEEIRLFLMAIWGLFFATEWLVKRATAGAENIEKA